MSWGRSTWPESNMARQKYKTENKDIKNSNNWVEVAAPDQNQNMAMYKKYKRENRKMKSTNHWVEVATPDQNL